MIKTTAIVLGAMTALGSLGACGAVGGAQKNGEALDESIRVYNEGMRWQRFDTAAARIPAVERATFVDEWDVRSKDLKITDYDIVNVEHKGKHANVQVKLSWYSDSEGTLHQTSATQVWEQHGQAWFMVDETRLRGPEMPGLPNKSEKSKHDAKVKAAKEDAAKDKADKADNADKADHADKTSAITPKASDGDDGIDAKVGLTDAPTVLAP